MGLLSKLKKIFKRKDRTDKAAPAHGKDID